MQMNQLIQRLYFSFILRFGASYTTRKTRHQIGYYIEELKKTIGRKLVPQKFTGYNSD